MPFINCCRYIDEKILPFADFLHTPTSFPLTKKATKSYFGIFLSFIMVTILIGLVSVDIFYYKSNYKISYFQDFIPIKDWADKTITLGFNVSENWTDYINYQLFDSEGKEINLTRCNENLMESDNGVYHCIINNSLKIDYDYAHVLKLFIYLNKNVSEYKDLRVPFSIAVKEPRIDHDNEENPLVSENESSVNKFRCFFNTSEITAYRRYLKYIKYKTIKRMIDWSNSTDDAIYIDDFEDSRKAMKNESDQLIGIYRIIASKKIDIYERKYITLKEFLSKIGGYISFLMSAFKFVTLFFVNPNDNYRIFDYLKKKKSIHLDTDSKSIYDDSSIKKKIENKDFNEVIMDNRFCGKFYYKLCQIFCRCFGCCYKKTQALSIINNYIQENLTIENYLESQILSKKLLKNFNKIDELKAKYLNIFKNKSGERLPSKMDYEIFDNDDDLNNNLLTDENIEMAKYKKTGTIYVEKEENISSFDEKQKNDIIKIVLETIF